MTISIEDSVEFQLRKNRNVKSISDLHDYLRESQFGTVPPDVARVEGMHNFSGALNDQKVVTRDSEGVSAYRKFTFERDSCSQSDTQEHHVNCLFAYSMAAKRDTWKILPRKDKFVGTVLKKPPNMRTAPAILLNKFSSEEINSFENRLRVTASRIQDRSKTTELPREIMRLRSGSRTEPGWVLGRHFSLPSSGLDGSVDLSGDQEGEYEENAELEDADELPYEEGR